MDREVLKKLLKDSYERYGFDVVSEQPNGETILRFPHPDTYEATLRISGEDISEYGELEAARREFRTIGNVGLANRNFREHLLLPLDASIEEADLRDLFFRADAKSKTYVEIDSVSAVFANYFRFVDGYMKLCMDRFYRLSSRVRRESVAHPIDIRQLFALPLSIRVYDIGARNIAEAVRISDELIEGTLFTLAYDYGISMMLAADWPKSRFERQQTLKKNDHKLNRVILPQAGFRRDLVRLYQAGLASPIATHRFLAFYQILQMFFQEVDHAGAYDALANFLRSDTFKPDSENLSRIVQLVEAHKRGIGESERLEQLLRQHVGAAAIKGFVELNGGTAEESIKGLASRLVAIHEAILNAASGALPLDDNSVARELPLMRFLAEQVILATREG
jgi:hypothetical protein